MSVKVKRGLGLLVVAVVALIAANLIAHIDADGVVGDWVLPLAFIGAALVMVTSAAVGLVLLAWGLLRD